MSQTLGWARRTRVFFTPTPIPTSPSTGILFPAALSRRFPYSSSADITTRNGFPPGVRHTDVVSYFRDWFMSRRNPLFDRIFKILRTQEGMAADSALSGFNLRLSEPLVLSVLNYEKKDILSCLKFFDWAGRQPGFYHTRSTFAAIFRMITKAKLTNLMLDLLRSFSKQRYDKVSYYNTLVIGYAVAGKSETALRLFGTMRFHGIDLDDLSYHILMNSLVEEGYYDYVETIVKEIRLRGFQNHITHSIMMKSFCNQNKLKKGERYLRRILKDDRVEPNGVALAVFVAALCKNRQFERASLLIDEFKNLGLGFMENAYGVWLKALVKAGRLDHALEFLKDKQGVCNYVPDIFRYNNLIWKLLKENRLEEVYDLLVDMKEKELLPDDSSMNAVLCFLCKTGFTDTAADLYNSRVEFGLSINYMTYNYLINTLLGAVSASETYNILKDSVKNGYLLGGKTFSLVAGALCREGKLDEMKELILFILDNNIAPDSLICSKFISALCSAGRVEEGYLIHDLVNRLSKASRKSVYWNMISGFCELRRGDIAARLLIEMQDSGYIPSRSLFREVICCLCQMDNGEKQFWGLLEMQLARNCLPISQCFLFFIEGAGFAGKPELALQVYEMMRRSGVEPNICSDILLLQSYLKNKRIAHALQLFCDFTMRWHNRRFWRAMIVGLCKIREPEYASKILESMLANKRTPSIECYEELIKLYCDIQQYHKAVALLNDMTKIGRPVSSFIGNIFLLNALRTKRLYDAWVSSSLEQNLTPTSWMLGHLVGVFSGCVEGNFDVKYVEELIQKCFNFDDYTNNIILRRLSLEGIDLACTYFNSMREKGHEPNKWNYDVIIHALAKGGRKAEAKKWMKEMFLKGYDLTEGTQRLL